MLEANPAPTTAGDTSGHPRQWRPGPRTRLGLSLGSLVVLLVVLAQWARARFGDAHTGAGRYDFSTYYAAAYALRHNLHANIYSQVVLEQAGAAGHVMLQPPLAYTYPPLFALLLSPFTLLSFKALAELWFLGNAALWLAITALLAREIAHLLRPALSMFARDTLSASGTVGRPADQSAPKGLRPHSPPARAGSEQYPSRQRAGMMGSQVVELLDDPLPLVALALAAWLSLTFVPAVQTLLTGQINFLVLAPLGLVPLLLRRGHDRWAGAAIAVAAILKFTPALLIVYLLLRRRWQAATAAAITLVGLFALSALAVGPGVAGASIGQALHIGTGDATLGHNQALFAPLLLFASLHAPAELAAVTILARLALALLAIALGYVIWHLPARAGTTASHPFTGAEAAAYGLALCGLLLLSPTAWVHHYVWVLPAAATALGLAVAQLVAALGAPRLPGAIVILALVALAGAALGVSLPYDWDTQPHPAITDAGPLTWPLALLLRPVATLVLASLLVFLGRSPDPDITTRPSEAADVLPLSPQGEGVGG